MDDLISRQAVVDAIKRCESADRYDFNNGMIRLFRALNAIADIPSAQPDIVACGDCIYWICHDRRCGYWNHGVKPLDWCCHAERRTNEAD